MCVSLYPQLQPWNVKKTLFGDCSDILGNSSRPEGHSFMPCRHYASAIITHETSGIKLRASESPVAKKGGVEDRADCKSRKEDCTRASPDRSCSIADPQHACHDALLAWQRSARGYYLKYLMTLMASMRVRKKGGLTRRREEGAYSKFDVGRDAIEDLLQLTLSAIKGADSDNRDGDRDRGDANRGEIALGGHPTHGHFSFSCDVHFQSPRSYSRQTISNIWDQNSQGDKMATCRRVVRYIVSDSLDPVHTASVAAMCAAQGCFFEALSACKLYHTQRTHQRKHRNAGQGVRQSSIVLVGDVAVAEKAVQMALSLCLQALICLVAKRALHTCAERYPVSATHTIDSSRSQKQEDAKLELSESDASKHLTAALALMRQSFLRAVPGPEHVDTNTVIGGSGTRAAPSKEEKEEEEEVVMERDIVEKKGEHLLDAVLVPLIAAIMSSPICACPNEAFERSGAQVGEKREKEIGKGTIKGVAAAGCSLYCTPNEVLASARTCTPSSSSSASSSASIRWCDIGGLHSAKQTITDVFLLPVIFRRMFQLSPIRMPRAVLLYGPPGCGKTVLAQAAATECGLAFISIRGNHGDYKLFFEVTNNVFSC